MKKTIGFIALCTAAVMTFSGCGTKNSTDISAESGAKLDFSKLSPEKNEMPISESEITLNVVTNRTATYAGKNYPYHEVGAFEALREKTGVFVNFEAVTDEKINLMFASDELPDMLLLNWNKLGGALKCASDGQIISLDEQLQKYAPNFTKLLAENKTIYAQLTEADGYVYQFPFIRGEQQLRVFQGFQIRQDWLSKLGLSVPKTRDEIYEVLKAFKERDPNGNGKADEIPYIAEKSYGIDRMFNFWGMDEFYIDNGKVKAGWLQPEFKEYVQWVKKLYDEGLLDPDYAITDRKQFDSKVSNEQGGAWYGLAGSTLGRLTTLMKPKVPDFKIAGMPWLAAPDGKSYAVNSEYVSCVTDLAYAISSQCKNVKAAVKWLDYGYSEEGSRTLNFGIEGKSYTMENGVPTYTQLITNNPDGLPMSEALAKYTVASGYPTMQSVDYFNQFMQTEQKDAIDVWEQADSTHSLPTLKHTIEESDIVSRKYTEIKSYHDSMINKIIIGKEPIEKFDEYTEKIKSMGIEDIVAAKQAAYDRYLKTIG